MNYLATELTATSCNPPQQSVGSGKPYIPKPYKKDVVKCT